MKSFHIHRKDRSQGIIWDHLGSEIPDRIDIRIVENSLERIRWCAKLDAD